MKTIAWLALLAVMGGMGWPLSINAGDFLYHWKADADPAVTAYGIYQRTGGSAYEKIDEVMVQDLDNPDKPSYWVTGLSDDSTYWFAATSIYASDGESDLSSKTCIVVNGNIDDCSDNDDNGATVYIQCFIRTAGEMFFSKNRTNK